MGRRRRGLQAALLVASALSCVLATLAGCAFEPGGAALAFVRGNQLWTMQPDGSNGRHIASGAIVGFAWSPDHHEIIYRTSLQGGVAPPMDLRVAAPDAPGDLYVTTINGNSPLQISASLGVLARSDAWWDPNGNRVLYRQFYPGPGAAPADIMYVESQIDQPLGIASKTLLDAAALPALSADGTRVAAIDPNGAVRVGAPATDGAIVASGALLQLASSRPARVYWQPGHDALLYATQASQGTPGVALVLRDLASGSARTLLTAPDLLDATFSPDGGGLLVRTAQNFSVYRVADSSAPVYSWPDDDPAAVAYWSPNGDFVLTQDLHGMRLANPGARTVTSLLAYASALGQAPAPASGLWRPAAGSPWSADNTGIVFAATSADMWHGARLAGSGTGSSETAGLYIGAISSDGTPGASTRIDAADDRAPTWSYADPATTFLLPS